MRCVGAALLLLSCVVTFPAATPIALAPYRGITQNGTNVGPTNNFAFDLKGVIRQIPIGQIEKLVQLYLLNDPEFQAVIRAVNSVPAYRVFRQFNNQPEVRQLLQWISQQLILSGSSLKIFDSLELEIKVINKYPYWAQMVNGVKGFQTEFEQLYPVESIRSLLETNPNPLIAELWQRLVALRVAYERVLALPATNSFVNELRRLGVIVDRVDATIRHQFGWSNATWSMNGIYYDYDYNNYY
ncbi:hypothetical protein KR018_005693 [Drosophila ironensis]|nr:hypothetical protein KR018_005693 [Drosophila ironensis]